MADSYGIICKTGINEWSKTGKISLNESGLSLVKLHGSIDWKKKEGPSDYCNPLTHNIVSKASSKDMQEYSHTPAVIFGQRNKLTADGPFLDLLKSFQRELSQTNILTVVGYSFRDSHINLYITNWLINNPAARIRIIDPGFIINPHNFSDDQNRNSYQNELLNFKRTSKDKVEVISKPAGEALKEIYGDYKSDTN